MTNTYILTFIQHNNFRWQTLHFFMVNISWQAPIFTTIHDKDYVYITHLYNTTTFMTNTYIYIYTLQGLRYPTLFYGLYLMTSTYIYIYTLQGLWYPTLFYGLY